MENKLQKAETKYYIPKIEEFCLGFEYEYKRGFMDGCVKTKEEFDAAEWIKDKIETTNSFPYIQRVFDGKNNENGLFAIRVKCLDGVDLEELGFWVAEILNDDIIHAKKDVDKFSRIVLEYDLFTHELKMELFAQSKMVGTRYRPEEWNSITIFRGEIKNKSELIRLLKQTNTFQTWRNETT